MEADGGMFCVCIYVCMRVEGVDCGVGRGYLAIATINGIFHRLLLTLRPSYGCCRTAKAVCRVAIGDNATRRYHV